MNKRVAAKLKSQGYDLELIQRVQNQSPTIFHSDFIDYGGGAATIVSIYDFPNQPQAQMWLRRLLDTKNTITLMKIGTENKAKLAKVINANLNGNSQILDDKWQNSQRKIEAQHDLNQNVNDLNDALNGREVYKRVYLRFMLVANSVEQVKQDYRDFKDKVSDYKVKIYAGEMATQAQQFFIPASQVPNYGLGDKGFPMKAYPLSGTYPFNQTFLSDPRGAYIGNSFQKGEIMFDPSFVDGKTRNTAFHVVLGDSGTGKTVYMHQLIDPLFARGDIIWTLDSTRRYIPHFKKLSGLILTMDGTKNMINPLHVYATVLDENGKIDAPNSFLQHVQRFVTFYSTLNSESDKRELSILSDYLTRYYISLGLWAYHPEEHLDELKATRALDASQYPTLEEFQAYMETQVYSAHAHTVGYVQQIVSNLRTMINNYGAMINGHTTVPNLQQEQVVLFDTAGIASGAPKLYSALYYNVLSLMNSYVVMNGFKQQQRQDAGEFSAETMLKGQGAPRYFWWIQDEANDVFNAHNPMGTELADRMMQQQRKNYFGFFAIFPGLKDVIPEGTQVDSAGARAVSDFFNRFSYQHLFRLPSKETERLKAYISKSDMTDAQFDTINELERGQYLLNIRGFQATFVTLIEPSDEEKRLYKGGL
ncbi:type IV secretion system protein VirB4 [Weissella minor]|uniref:type IV secretion system protein VirB4 n=1 Tax=Weissella minor TaxID=1620 RepID=UPI001BAF7162|nr:type IV secretion system protein VirB4 [Weissella minor]MBS0949216.1 type IV secretion system protein VirB4 [Weissella minor]